MTDGTVYAVSSDLTGEAHTQVVAIWDYLEQRYGLRAAKTSIQPHVTYVAGDCAQPQAVAEHLAGVAGQIRPFNITLDEIGVFTDEAPVVFLRVAACPSLRHTHSLICEAAQKATMSIWPYYLPDVWVPHVTLALQDLAPDLLPAVLTDLEARPTRFVTRLQSVELVHVISPQHRYLGRFRLEANVSDGNDPASAF